MSSERLPIVLTAVAIVASSLVVQACWAKDPCGEGLVLQHEGMCIAAIVADAAAEAAPAAPATDAGDGEGGGDAAGDGPAPAAEAAPPSSFGKTCAAMTDCSGDAPICGAPNLPYCTQINCQPGEANAGACPAGYTCFTAPGYPSACLRN
jgi:hypothetical protein